ncbi:MAG TPA: flagellar hook-length control protein FliK [Burkholderiales bacterium]|nr:flagellar hook-length control protein FliK [Burkholderiales bacterium]
MIQPELLGRLRLLAEAYRIPLASPSDKPNEVAPVPGVRQVQAEVEARLADGRFRVFAAGERFEMDLPAQTRPGDRVRIALPPATASQEASPRVPAPSVESRVSPAGRLVSELAQRMPGDSGTRTPGSISAAQPLLPDAPVRTDVAAATLRELIALSGLFYESHQAEWVGGARDTQQLLREPQGQLSKAGAQNSARDSQSSPATESAPAGAAPSSADPGAAHAEPRPISLHPGAAPIVQQQIRALEAHHIVWNGQVWQGQAMRWEIEETDQQGSGSGDSARAWQTSVDLELPRLGAIHAVMTLSGGSLGVRIHAESRATDALFAQRLVELRQALLDAGLPVSGIVREAHGHS